MPSYKKEKKFLASFILKTDKDYVNKEIEIQAFSLSEAVKKFNKLYKSEKGAIIKEI